MKTGKKPGSMMCATTVCHMTRTRQGSVVAIRCKNHAHVEYEILQHILDDIDISIVKETMVVAPRKNKAEERFDKGAKKLMKLLVNMMERRRHLLPEEHPDYKEKEA